MPITHSTDSAELLRRFQGGNDHALDQLWTRYLPRLKRWARGRLPQPSRWGTDTDDLIQDAFVRSVARLRTLDPAPGRGLFAYVKTIILNQIRDQLRQSRRRRPPSTLDEARVPSDECPSPLEQVLGRDLLDRYWRALSELSPDDHELVLAAVELRWSDEEIAVLFEKPTVNAARMARVRALGRLGRAMQHLDVDAQRPRS